MIGHLNTCNQRLLRYLKPANSIGALPAGAATWYVPGHGKLTTREMLRVAAGKEPE